MDHQGAIRKGPVHEDRDRGGVVDIGPLSRADDVEKPEGRTLWMLQNQVFARQLASGVDRHRLRRGVLVAGRGGIAIYSATTCKNESCGGVCGSLGDDGGAVDIDLPAPRRISFAFRDRCDGREVKDVARGGDSLSDGLRVRDARFNDPDPIAKLLAMAGREVIDDRDFGATVQQGVDQMPTDESTTTSDDHATCCPLAERHGPHRMGTPGAVRCAAWT